MTFRAAVVGLGRIGSSYPEDGTPRTHAGAYAATSGIELIAGVDPSEEARQAFCDRWGVSLPVYESVDDMMQAQKPDIVSVCVHPLNLPQVTARCAAYTPRVLFLEKPLAVDPTGADVLRKSCAAIPAAVNYHRCWDPAHERFFANMKQAGKVVGGRVMYGKGLLNYASHIVALLLRHLGPVKAVAQVGTVPDPEAADPSPSFLLRFETGAEIVFQGLPHAGFDLLELELVTPSGVHALKSGGCRRRVEEPKDGAFYPNYPQLIERPSLEPDGQVQGLAQAVLNIENYLQGATDALNCDLNIGLEVLDVLWRVSQACGIKACRSGEL